MLHFIMATQMLQGPFSAQMRKENLKSGPISQCSNNFYILKAMILFLYMVTFRTWIYGQSIMVSMSIPITNQNIYFISCIPFDNKKNHDNMLSIIEIVCTDHEAYKTYSFMARSTC